MYEKGVGGEYGVDYKDLEKAGVAAAIVVFTNHKKYRNRSG